MKKFVWEPNDLEIINVNKAVSKDLLTAPEQSKMSESEKAFFLNKPMPK